MMIMSIEDHIGIGDPLEEGDIQVKVEGPLEDPLIVEDPLEMEDPLDPPVDKDHQAIKDPLGQ